MADEQKGSPLTEGRAVNNWEIPKTARAREGMKDAGRIAEFYEAEASSGGD